MNRSIRNARRLVVLAPAIALAASAAATAALAAIAAPARADTGPVGFLTTDSTGRNAIGPVADKATPVVRSVGVTMDSITNSTSVSSSATRKGAQSRLGPGTLRTARGDMRFSSMAVRCGSTTDEMLYGVMTLDPQGVVAPALAGIPQRPPVNYRVPSAVPGKEIILNRQVRDATGALTVTAMTVTDKTGMARGYGAARCTPGTLPSATGTGARSGSPLPAPAAAGRGALPPATVDSLRGLLNTVNLGTLPQEPATSGWGAVLEPEKANLSNLGAPGAQPRPSRREPVAGPSDALGAVPGLSGLIAGPVTGTLPASTGALLGGAPGLPLGG